MREDILKGCGKFLFEDDFEDSDDLFEHNVNCGDQMIRNGSTQYCSECQAKLSGYDQAIRDIFKKIKWALKLASPKDNALNYKKYQEDVIELIKEEPQNSNQSQQTKPIINSIVNAKSDDGSVTDKTADTSQEVMLNQAIKEVLEKIDNIDCDKIKNAKIKRPYYLFKEELKQQINNSLTAGGENGKF
jgi:hypothetical protein